jgi:uncharacterized short protein YbdD (DUF466 family)
VFERLRRVAGLLTQTARLMVGVPDYETYVARRRQFNPGATVLSRGEFVRYCMQRRFGGRGPRGCC